MAVLHWSQHKLLVFRLEANGTSTLLHTIGGSGAGPKQFKDPNKMCLAPNGNMLVCEYGNNRVQELTGPGETEPAHVRDITGITQPCSCAVYGDMLAVGTYVGTVVLLSYSTGTIIRTIGSKGAGRGNIGNYAVGIRFSLDGGAILVAEHDNKRLSKFRMPNGEFEDFVCADQISNGHKDVEIAPKGEIIVADIGANRVCVFSMDGRTLLRTWGTCGTANGQFRSPTALALVGNQLFVLDVHNARVQVFE